VAFIKTLFFAMIQIIWLLLFAPLLVGVMRKVKARLQGKIGPRLLQPYYDLQKYFQKEAVFSKHSSWLTRGTPYIVFIATIISALALPVIGKGFGTFSDVLIFIYLLAMGRIFTAFAALDTASSFGGMGASREMALNTVIEPAFILALVAVIIQTKTTNFSQILAVINDTTFYVSLPYFLVFAAMLFVILGETGRIPVDNEDTHLELTMIHEGMVLEYSGRYLALMKFSSFIKQYIFITLFVILFLPFYEIKMTGFLSGLLAVSLITIKVFLVGIFISIVEVMYAKVRIYQVPKLFVTSMTLSFLAIVVHLLF